MVQGLAELNRRWGAIPERVRTEVVKAMEKAAEEIVEDMRRLVRDRSGELAASIGWTWGDAPVGSLIVGRLGSGEDYGAVRITLYAGNEKAFYARWVEFGTQPHSLTKNASVERARKGSRLNQRRQETGVRHPGAAPHPFFFPVWRVWRKRIKSRLRAAMRRGMAAR